MRDKIHNGRPSTEYENRGEYLPGSAQAAPRYRQFILVAGVVAVVVYLSLYPFLLRNDLPASGPFESFIKSWRTWPESRGDFIANAAFYLPCGYFLLGCFSKRMPTLLRLFATVLLCALLSTAIELSQSYIATRVSDIRDTYANSFGSLLGSGAAIIFGVANRLPLIASARRNPFPTLMVAAFLGARLYPYVPVIDLHKYLRAIRPLLAFAIPTPDEIFLRTACWMAVYFLLEFIFGRRRGSPLFVATAACVFGGDIAIDNAEIRVGELLGAILALPLSLVLFSTLRRRGAALAIIFTTAVVIERLQPFQFSVLSNGFGWIPFVALVHGSNEHSLVTISEKAFLYGTLIWLWVEAGLSCSLATIGTALLLLACSVAETHIPTRVAETTDAAIALILGAAIASLPSAPSWESVRHELRPGFEDAP